MVVSSQTLLEAIESGENDRATWSALHDLLESEGSELAEAVAIVLSDPNMLGKNDEKCWWYDHLPTYLMRFDIAGRLSHQLAFERTGLQGSTWTGSPTLEHALWRLVWAIRESKGLRSDDHQETAPQEETDDHAWEAHYDQ